MRLHRALSTTSLLALAMTTGCLYSPANESVVPTKETPIDFEGWAAANSSVHILAAGHPAEDFEEFTSFPTDASGGFLGSEVVPLAAWRPMCDDVGGWETFLRADNAEGSGSLGTFDDPSITGVDGQDCIAGYIAEGNWTGAFFNCISPDSPTVRIHASAGGTGVSSIDGDVLIDSPADAEDLACVQTIYGSLTIDDGVVQDLSLPSLQEVTGDVTIVFERSGGVFPDVESVALPALHTIGGALDLLSPNPPGESQNISIGFGMPALINLGGDLEIEIASFNCSVRGIDALTHMPGNLAYDSCSADGTASSLLPALVSIGGDLDVTFGSSTQQQFFNSIQTIAGDATIRNGGWTPNADGTGSMFSALTTVLGRLHVIDVSIFAFPTPRAFDALASAGTLDWDSGGTMESIGAPAVTLGGLRLNDNGWLTDLPTLMSKYTIDSSAPITISNNVNLAECSAWAWADGLSGHVGPVDIFGNLVCRTLSLPPIIRIEPIEPFPFLPGLEPVLELGI